MKKGFTLVELLAVLVILAAILLITIPTVRDIEQKSKLSARKASIDLYGRAVNQAIEVYQLKNKTDPKNFSDIEEYIEYSGDKVECAFKFIEKDFTVSLAKCKVGGKYVEGYTFGKDVIVPSTFAEDDWETIIAAVKKGIYPYQLGDTKKINLGTYGTHTIRITNTTPCDGTLESETACGFVLEFTDIIRNYKMKGYQNNLEGWPKTDVRNLINDNIYNALPEELRNAIIDTTVVSGHGKSETLNFTSTDKLYLFSTKEIFGSGYSRDTVQDETRQLDYYNQKEVTSTTNYSLAIRRNSSNSASTWWLRSADNGDEKSFLHVDLYGRPSYGYWSTNSVGVSPAFRIG